MAINMSNEKVYTNIDTSYKIDWRELITLLSFVNLQHSTEVDEWESTRLRHIQARRTRTPGK